jgi:hypothetical protein
MKETGPTISGMAMTLSCCWTILFLTTFPALVFGGRRDPAAGATGQWISEGPAEASAEYHFAETIHGVAAAELDNKIQNPHQLQEVLISSSQVGIRIKEHLYHEQKHLISYLVPGKSLERDRGFGITVAGCKSTRGLLTSKGWE